MNAYAAIPKAEKKFITTKEVSEVTKNIVLEGIETLRAEKVTTTFEVTREVHPKTNQPYELFSKKKLDEKVEPLCFPLVEVTQEILADARKNGIPSFVLKFEGRLFYSAIPNDINFMSSTILGSHKCSSVGHDCNRLSALSDEKGGCEKVRKRSKYIERYPWITKGYETFNTKHDSFVVSKCLHYENCPPKVSLTPAELTQK